MIGIILTGLVAVEALYIMGLEMFASSKKQAETFDIDEEITKLPEVRILLGNQGIYNGMLGIIILLTMVSLDGAAKTTMLEMFMAYVIIVAIYGSVTSSKRILLFQGLPAALALLALFLHI